MSDTSYPTITCEVLQGENKLGYVVELRFTEIPNKKWSNKIYKLCEGFYKTFTEAIEDDSSPTTKNGEKEQ